MTGRQKFNIISLVLFFTGAVLLLYPLFSYTYSAYSQYNLKKALQSDLPPFEEKPSPDLPPVLSPENNGGKNKTEENGGKNNNEKNQKAPPVAPEDALAVIESPKIGLSAVVVRGTIPAQLRKGPGWYPGTSLPGEPGNMAIAGHRSTYGAWFRHLDRLEKGDLIYLKYQGKTFTYEVEKVFSTAKNDWSVVSKTPYPALTLTACHPAGSDRQRLIVRARLTS
jgi:sortase A